MNGLLENYSHILTGYIGSASFLEAVASVIERV
jgi:pyridoxal/pyridoxine/pyridoxamine kinase